MNGEINTGALCGTRLIRKVDIAAVSKSRFVGRVFRA